MTKRSTSPAEPSVPAGLAELTGPQRVLADFLRVPQDLLAVAASDSAQATESVAAPDRLAAFIAGLPAPEKDTLLLQASLGTAPQLGPGLLARFRQSLRPSEGSPGVRRGVAQLLDAAHRHRTVSAPRERASGAAGKPEYGRSPRPATRAWTTWPETRRPPGAPSTTSSPSANRPPTTRPSRCSATCAHSTHVRAAPPTSTVDPANCAPPTEESPRSSADSTPWAYPPPDRPAGGAEPRRLHAGVCAKATH